MITAARKRKQTKTQLFRFSSYSHHGFYFTDQPQMLNAAMCAAMDDILIVTTKQSELGILWVSYLKACFDKITKQRGRLGFK